MNVREAGIGEQMQEETGKHASETRSLSMGNKTSWEQAGNTAGNARGCV